MDIKLMVMASLMAGLLSTMNVWVVNKNHVRLHLNDIYMVFLMTGWMIFFDTINHYEYKKLLTALVIIVVSLILIRGQFFINDDQFINGMIPHHSMAILMSEKIKDKTTNKKIRDLANSIIINQQKEIDLMNNIIKN